MLGKPVVEEMEVVEEAEGLRNQVVICRVAGKAQREVLSVSRYPYKESMF